MIFLILRDLTLALRNRITAALSFSNFTFMWIDSYIVFFTIQPRYFLKWLEFSADKILFKHSSEWLSMSDTSSSVLWLYGYLYSSVQISPFNDSFYSLFESVFVCNMPKGYEFSQEIKQLMFNEIDFVESEKDGSVIPLNSVNDRLKSMLGIPMASVERLRREMREEKNRIADE